MPLLHDAHGAAFENQKPAGLGALGEHGFAGLVGFRSGSAASLACQSSASWIGGISQRSCSACRVNVASMTRIAQSGIAPKVRGRNPRISRPRFAPPLTLRVESPFAAQHDPSSFGVDLGSAKQAVKQRETSPRSTLGCEELLSGDGNEEELRSRNGDEEVPTPHRAASTHGSPERSPGAALGRRCSRRSAPAPGRPRAARCTRTHKVSAATLVPSPQGTPRPRA